MFNLEVYKNFVKQQVTDKIVYNGIDITERLLEALFQFEKSPSAYLENIERSTLSKRYKQLFNTLNKSDNRQLNIWFLHNYGYKHCYICNEIKTLSEFSKNITTCSKLNNCCRNCDSKQTSKFYLSNPEYTETYRKSNSEKFAGYSSKRRAIKKQAIPILEKDLAIIERVKIQKIFDECKQITIETGIKHHVDHIKPLSKGGLHVSSNLQILTATENLKKSNKF